MPTDAPSTSPMLSSSGFVGLHLERAHIAAGEYRPDVDGLRAVAVLLVMGFHAFPTLIPGGFVGVDVFFVISGFLISRQILTELSGGSFRIRAFYARRIKRIFPALILVLVASTLAGWVLLTPNEYELLGRPIAGGASFAANFVFWKEAGYFDMAADTKPLLHLWSLGIEEQFYIVWPFLVAWLWRRSPAAVGKGLSALLLVSLIYSLWLVSRDTVADFYSPLTRFWELGLGAGVAWWVQKHGSAGTPSRPEVLSWTGVILIVIAVMTIEKDHRFPGAWALLPTVGAACLILSGAGTRVNRGLLSLRGLVWIGLISYPLYLWHWPLLSFARIMESQTPSADVRAALLGASVVCAWLTYRFVELPIRATPAPKLRRRLVIMSLCMVVLFCAGVAIRKMDGVKTRVLGKLNGDVATLVLGKDRHSLRRECGVAQQHRELFKFCLSGGSPVRFAVLGDSKAEALYYGLVRESGSQGGAVLIGSVRPPRSETGNAASPDLRNRVALQRVLDDAGVTDVLFVVALRSTFRTNPVTGYVEGDTSTESADWLERYTEAIGRIERAGKRAVFVVDNPTFPDPRSCISGGMTSSAFLNQFLRRKPNPRCAIRLSEHIEGTRAYGSLIGELARRNPGLLVYDPSPLLCNVERDECAITRDGKFLYSYSDHISDYANSLIARDLLSVLGKSAR